MHFKAFLASFPGRLERVTSGGRVIREIDGLRFLAIFPVVIQHLSERLERNASISFSYETEYEWVSFLTNRGFIGVYIFFVISGFILAMPFAASALNSKPSVSLKSYFWRRITRLEPPYVILMTIVAIFLVAFGYYSFSEILPHWGASLLYVHSIIYNSWSYLNPPVWTLEIEVQFYILAPFLAMALFRIRDSTLRRLVLVIFIGTIMTIQQITGVLHGHLNLTILGHLQYFILGFLLADIFLVNWKDGITKKPIFNWIGIGGFILVIFSWSWDFYFLNRVVFCIALLLVAYSAFRSTWFNKFLTLPWITAIGGMCYTIYLVHLPIIEFLIKYTKAFSFTNLFIVNFIIQFLIIVPVIFIVSVVYYLLIEKPCMHKDWPQKFRNFIKLKFTPLFGR